MDGKAVYNASIQMLGRREYSEAELTTKLRQKFQTIPADMIEEVLAKLKLANLQSDTRYAEMLIRSRISRGYGPSYIRQELAIKGIEGELVEAQLESTDTDWLALATDLVERRHDQATRDVDAWARAVRFLQRRGFNSDLVAQAVGDKPVESITDEAFP